MIPELDEKQRKHMLAVLFDIIGCGSATELAKMTDVSTMTIVKGKCKIKDALRDPRACPNPSEQGRIMVPVRAVSPHRRLSQGLTQCSNPCWTITLSAIPKAP